jgi:hypothetical protein
MKENDIIKIKSEFKGLPKEMVGKFGFIEEDAGLIKGVRNWIVIIVENDGIPLGNGPVPESCLEITTDEVAIKAVNAFNAQLKKVMDGTREQAIDIDKGLQVLSKKYDLPVDKLREIYTDVYELTKGIIDGKNPDTGSTGQTSQENQQGQNPG